MCVCCIMSFFEFLSYQERQARRTALSPNWERLRKSIKGVNVVVVGPFALGAC